MEEPVRQFPDGPSAGSRVFGRIMGILGGCLFIVIMALPQLITAYRERQDWKKQERRDEQAEAEILRLHTVERDKQYQHLAASADHAVNTGLPILVGDGVLHATFDGRKLYENNIDGLSLSFWLGIVRSRCSYADIDAFLSANPFRHGEDCQVSPGEVARWEIVPRGEDFDERVKQYYVDLAKSYDEAINKHTVVRVGDKRLHVAFRPEVLHDKKILDLYMSPLLMSMGGKTFPDLDAVARERLLGRSHGDDTTLADLAELSLVTMPEGLGD